MNCSCDSMVLSAATEAETIRAAVAAGALSYLVKPFAPAELAARLSGYARYRRILSGTNLERERRGCGTGCASPPHRHPAVLTDRRIPHQTACAAGPSRFGQADVVG